MSFNSKHLCSRIRVLHSRKRHERLRGLSSWGPFSNTNENEQNYIASYDPPNDRSVALKSGETNLCSGIERIRDTEYYFGSAKSTYFQSLFPNSAKKNDSSSNLQSRFWSSKDFIAPQQHYKSNYKFSQHRLPSKKHGIIPSISPSSSKMKKQCIRSFSTQPSPSKNKETKSQSSSVSQEEPSNELKAQTRMESFSIQLQSIPNIITVTRIVCTPYLSYLIISHQYTYALGGCFLAAFSDYMDGYIAKQYDMKTVLGTYLDPFADKLIINTLAVSLGYQELLPIWIVGLWLARDVGLMGTTYWWVRKNTDMSKGQAVIDPGKTPLQVHPTNISKINTVLQFFALFGGISVGLMDGTGQEILLGLW